jgi:two-component system, cell cycle response regulator
VSAQRILVVDDSDVTRALLVRALQRAGYEVITARDGAEGAVAALREQPAVVVTDLEMPVMDGYQLLRLLKSDPSASHIPVVILTSHGEAPSRFWGLRTGADAYLTKDYEPEELITTVARLAEGRAGAAAPQASPLQGPLDVLARVARQLDANLLQATLATTLLKHGMGISELHEACRRGLGTIAEVVDAPLLALAISEPETVAVHVMLTEPVAQASAEACASALLHRLAVNPGATVDAKVTGQQGGPAVDPARLVFFPLPLTAVAGGLVILPREELQFDQVSRYLVDNLLPHVAVLLDNARLTQRLQELSTHDGLTRLLNHRAIHERLREELQRANRFHHPLAVIISDLDHFKRVNDSHGHLAGDAVLRGAAAALRSTLRACDVIGRYGGEEFLVVLTESDLEAGRQAAERLRRALADAPIPLPSGEAIPVTGSFGVAAFAEIPPPITADKLLTLADTRLYEAKARGRNCVRP